MLVSWAVPKGVPEDTAAKRLAVHVEDHPLEYGKFEGEIPKGNYGAGTVAIWDRGTWEPAEKNWRSAFEKGKLRFSLSGERLDGNFVLARMGEEPNWLFRKLADSPADPAQDLPKEPAKFVEPQLARLSSTVPAGSDWIHEIKLDGYRLIAVKAGGKVSLITRNGHDWTEKFASLADAMTGVSKKDFVLDGEAVVFDEKGRSNFGDLQAALQSGSGGKISFVAFDLLNYDNRKLRDLPLSARQERLAELLDETGRIQRSKVWAAEMGADLFKQACKMDLEGIISKPVGARYYEGGRRDWLKSKCRARQEFIICGYTEPKGSLEGFGAILLASFENGKLVPRGKVGTGFTAKKRLSLLKTFEKLETKKPPLQSKERGVTWLRPELVAEIGFAEITRDGSIRQGSFIGMREDKGAAEVHLEGVEKAKAEDKDQTVAGVKISHPDRVIYPQDGVSKIEVARYFERVGELMMPYVAHRPLALLRAPSGISGDLFFQKSFPNHVPAHVEQTELEDGTKIFYIKNPEGLVSLAQFGAIEIHPWGATVEKPDVPDYLTWDLDPDQGVSWKEVLGAAFFLRDYLLKLGLDPMLKTSGGKGLHLMVRIRRSHDWDTMREFTKDVARAVMEMAPGKFIIVATKAKRTGKIFLDWMRNGRGSTCIAPWGLRAREGAKISMPVSWDDLGELPAEGFNIHEPPNTPPEWLKPVTQSITKAMIVSVKAG